MGVTVGVWARVGVTVGVWARRATHLELIGDCVVCVGVGDVDGQRDGRPHDGHEDQRVPPDR
eukprot:6470551-Prymnesium_polylepis.2